jgi:hypothetical protein
LTKGQKTTSPKTGFGEKMVLEEEQERQRYLGLKKLYLQLSMFSF